MIISNQFRSISIKINEYSDLNRYLSNAFIANISNDELKETDTPHYTDYYSLESNGPFALSYKTMSDKDKLEMLFMKNIRFLSVKKNGNENNCEDYNNVITLSNELLNDFNTFRKIFIELSDGDCFNNYPSVGTSKMKEENKTLYNFSLTKWLIQKPSFSLCELIVAQFELHIVVNYIYNLTYRTICDFDFFEGIEVIFNSNRDLVKYLQGIEKKVELFEKINFNVSGWDVSNVENMDRMFIDCEKFDCDLSDWNTSKVKYTDDMFFNCKNFTGEGLENWNVSNVVIFEEMFFECKNFDSDLSNWDVSKSDNLMNMFKECSKFKGKGLENWNVKDGTKIYNMFAECNLIKKYPDWYIKLTK